MIERSGKIKMFKWNHGHKHYSTNWPRRHMKSASFFGGSERGILWKLKKIKVWIYSLMIKQKYYQIKDIIWR